MNTTKQELISKAINYIQAYIKTDALKINILNKSNDNIDSFMKVKYLNYNEITYRLKIKNNITNLQQIKLLKETNDKNSLIICRGLTKAISEKMIKNKIQFMDLFGNIYLENKFFLIYSTGKIIPPDKTKLSAGRAFSKTGLKTTFQFILDPTLVNKNYRTISEIVNVSLGSLKWIFQHLKNEDLLLSSCHRQRILHNKPELMNKWIPAYKEKLRPTLIIGRYRFAKNLALNNWTNLLDNMEETFWGCEPAVALLDNYLKPEIFTIYSNKPEHELIKSLKLIPDEKGNIEILRTFWNLSYFNYEQAQIDKVVPRFLVYADLINSGISRNLEAAELLRLKNDS
ncbi:MAG: type IV toxin-antitoxin system AbiEi family antitoxin [Candidatus Cloacimonadales bacterium]